MNFLVKYSNNIIISIIAIVVMSITSTAYATTYNSCLEALNAGNHTDGTYNINGIGQAYCDMHTNGGGWLGVTPSMAKTTLGGSMVVVDGSANTSNSFDGSGRPMTRDGSGAHTAYYTFSLPFDIKEFFLKDYKAMSNSGSGQASDIYPSRFKQSMWNIAHGSSVGDISFGFADMVGPMTSFANVLGRDAIFASNDQISWPAGNQVFTSNTMHRSFRIGWGEEGQPDEGWMPWYQGMIMVRGTYTAPPVPVPVPTGYTSLSINGASVSGDSVNVSTTVSATGTTYAKMKVEYSSNNNGSCVGQWNLATVGLNVSATYNDVNGAPFVNNFDQYQIGNIYGRRIKVNNGVNTVNFVWNIFNNIPKTNSGRRCIRITAIGDNGKSDTKTRVVAWNTVVPPQPNPQPGPGQLCTPYLTKFMRYGQYNDPSEVMKLQQFLNSKEFEHLTINGIFDANTYQAVVRYQTKYARDILYPWGMTAPSGFVYKTTMNHINRRMCSSSTRCPVFTRYQKIGDYGGEVAKIQEFLTMYGYYHGPISGYFDMATDVAIKAYQDEFRPMILTPWHLTRPTGFWYKTSRKQANWLQGCFERVYLEGIGVTF